MLASHPSSPPTGSDEDVRACECHVHLTVRFECKIRPVLQWHRQRGSTTSLHGKDQTNSPHNSIFVPWVHKERRQVVSAVTTLCLHSGSHCSLDSNSMVVTLRVMIGMSCKLAAYIIKAAFEWGLSMSWWNRVYPGIEKFRVRPATRSVVATRYTK